MPSGLGRRGQGERLHTVSSGVFAAVWETTASWVTHGAARTGFSGGLARLCLEGKAETVSWRLVCFQPASMYKLSHVPGGSVNAYFHC